MSRLHDLFSIGGQSPWLDFVSRPALDDGTITKYIENGVRGITSNPSIFEKALNSTDAYDADIEKLASEGKDADAIFWELAIDDIQRAADLLRPLYDESNGNDGYISLEVDPRLAHNTEETVKSAKDLWARVDRPNLMVKIPATVEGIPAIEQAIAAGINVNVTLIFSLDRYRHVIDAYVNGCEQLPADNNVRSVASFFVSRVDVAVDDKVPAELKGKVALAQAQAAHGIFLEAFKDTKVRPQRPLWASTGTKNPDYPDTLYVDELITENTVNTIPEKTMTAFLDHGTVAETITPQSITDAILTLEAAAEAGVDFEQVTDTLENEGVAAFEKSFETLLGVINGKL